MKAIVTACLFQGDGALQNPIEEAREMKKAQKKEVLVDAKEAYSQKKVHAAKNNSKGPEQPKAKTATKPKQKLDRSAAAKLVWATKRATIIAGIKQYWKERKATEAKS
jgi:hypothetical protein